jgi:hypothetical protein
LRKFYDVVLLALCCCGAPPLPKAPVAAGEQRVAKELVGRLDLERYRATLKGLTRFGDRRQGTERNRRALDYIEAELRQAGCAAERHRYVYDPAKRPKRTPPKPGVAADSTPFMDLAPSISLHENERGTQIGSGWDPHWHQPTDLYATFSDPDFRLGLNAAQTTLGALAELLGTTLGQ